MSRRVRSASPLSVDSRHLLHPNSSHSRTSWRMGKSDRGCVKTSARFRTSLLRSFWRGLRAFRVEKIAKKSCSARSFTNFAEFLHGPDPSLPFKIGPVNGRFGKRQKSGLSSERRRMRLDRPFNRAEFHSYRPWLLTLGELGAPQLDGGHRALCRPISIDAKPR
jgi:hypothetical protein